MNGKSMAVLLAIGLSLAGAGGTASAGSKPGGAGNEVVGALQDLTAPSAHPGPFDRSRLAQIREK
jgi:hypothetical protein